MTQRPHHPYTVTLAAGEEIPINAGGRQVVCLAATGAFAIKIGEEGGFGDFEAGLARTLAAADSDFNIVRVRDTSGAPNIVTLAIGYGDVRDSRLVLTAPVKSAGAGTVTTIADVSLAATATTQIIATNAGRRTVELTNLSPTVTLRIGDNNAGATRGVELVPGETRSFPTSAALHGYNPSGAPVMVGVLELEN